MPEEYLGDGVYASFDGYQIWLAIGDHRHKLVALEPAVLGALVQYAARINTENNVDHFPVVSG